MLLQLCNLIKRLQTHYYLLLSQYRNNMVLLYFAIVSMATKTLRERTSFLLHFLAQFKGRYHAMVEIHCVPECTAHLHLSHAQFQSSFFGLFLIKIRINKKRKWNKLKPIEDHNKEQGCKADTVIM